MRTNLKFNIIEETFTFYHGKMYVHKGTTEQASESIAVVIAVAAVSTHNSVLSGLRQLNRPHNVRRRRRV